MALRCKLKQIWDTVGKAFASLETVLKSGWRINPVITSHYFNSRLMKWNFLGCVRTYFVVIIISSKFMSVICKQPCYFLKKICNVSRQHPS